ncbi:AAA family ATPase [Nannocystis radixulma]|uniref:endopeptidase La n=1 Tax=Nannocystis radixulma TaxID=2995305 RepID=A0ABT5B0A4_9BACT|nr:AAA family ATPase [Nannocystis radixulma]MDC0666959.1 AAA family ATPase [Nannocystis radixulma]
MPSRSRPSPKSPRTGSGRAPRGAPEPVASPSDTTRLAADVQAEAPAVAVEAAGLRPGQVSPLGPEQCTVTVREDALPEGPSELALDLRIAPQHRAAMALRRGLAERAPGFNVAVVGRRGTGRTFTAVALAREEAARRPAPRDLVLLVNPRWPLEPVPAFLPAGAGPAFVRAMEELHARLEAAVHEVFEGRVRHRLHVEIHREQSAAERKIHDQLSKIAAEHGLGLVANDDGFDFVPLDEDEDEAAADAAAPAGDAAADPAEASEAEARLNRQVLDAIEAVRPHVEETQRQLALLEAEIQASLLQRQRAALRNNIAGCFAQVPERALPTEQVRKYSQRLHEHLQQVYHLEEGHHLPLTSVPLPAGLVVPTLLVTSRPDDVAPIIHAQNVTLSGLFGRVVAGSNDSRYPEPGTILAGDLHRANGGFLIIDAEALVKREAVYEHLKACLLARAIQPHEEDEGPSLRIQPVELDVKVVLVADPDLIHQLQELDPEFSRLFKIRADFEDDMSFEEGLRVYPGVAAWLASNRGLSRCSRSAVAFLMQHGARLAEDQHRLTTNLGLLSDLITEATSLARDADELTEEHLRAALRLIRDRQGQMRDRLLDLHRYGLIRVEVSGQSVGQINGLAVVSDGFQSVGRPSRVTAVTYAGSHGPLNIEREVEMSGPIHSKGVLILSGYLHDRFARDFPLSFGASVVFEQTYTPIEGDSASTAELFAILSSLSGVPARQDIGITGSVDQRGRVLPVGGINEKIEGFFEVCRAHALTGTQGVVIPESNVRNLVLGEDVLEAIAQGRFFIWPISTVEEGVELILGEPAGTATEPEDEAAAFRYPERTVYGRVERRIARLRQLASPPRG